EHMTIADITGDGNLDIVASGYGSVAVFVGQGDGTFRDYYTVQFGGQAGAVAVGDLTGSGRLDLVAALPTRRWVSVLLNGSRNPQIYPLGAVLPIDVQLVDLRGNGILDIVTVNQSSRYFTVLTGNGDGTFQSPHNISIGPACYHAATGDFNQDGNVD